MSKDPLVSVIVPAYNVARYVEKCINSLTEQTYRKLEIIVVDDGATDNSGEICDELAKHDKRITVYHKMNGGLSRARNFGIKKATGKYICLVDSDDYVEKDFVRKLVYKAEIKNADIVVCSYNEKFLLARMMTGEDAAIRLLTKQENVDIVAWNKMYRRELFDKIQYPEGENYEDTLTTYKLYAEAKNVAYIGDSLYEYVERDDSITGDGEKEDRLLAREKAAREAVEYFDDRRRLKKAAEIALYTANLAYMDFAINGKIGKSYYYTGKEWIIKNEKKLRKNPFLTKKLKLYLNLITRCGGLGYLIFRKVRHE